MEAFEDPGRYRNATDQANRAQGTPALPAEPGERHGPAMSRADPLDSVTVTLAESVTVT
jgi:hypothetical protein